MCVLYVRLGVLPWVLLCCFILISILPLYSAESGGNRVQVVLPGFSLRLL